MDEAATAAMGRRLHTRPLASAEAGIEGEDGRGANRLAPMAGVLGAGHVAHRSPPGFAVIRVAPCDGDG